MPDNIPSSILSTLDEFSLNDFLALALLKAESINPKDAALLVIDLVKEHGHNLRHLKKNAFQGIELIKEHNQSVSFLRAVHENIKVKKHRRERTRSEIKYIMNTLMRKNPGLAYRKIRTITSNDCSRFIEHAFKTPHRKHKARSILSGIFTVACKRGWCSSNPVHNVDIPALPEVPIQALTIDELNQLFKVLKEPRFISCKSAVALMLYAGIRPREVERLEWGSINFEDRVITITPQHSKTGGARHVTILPPLFRILKEHSIEDPQIKICPKNWVNKWRSLREKAGWSKDGKQWQKDCLRHTYASYHLKYFRNISLLQVEMGHSSPQLLLTRYLNMQGITNKSALVFFEKETFPPIFSIDSKSHANSRITNFPD